MMNITHQELTLNNKNSQVRIIILNINEIYFSYMGFFSTTNALHKCITKKVEAIEYQNFNSYNDLDINCTKLSWICRYITIIIDVTIHQYSLILNHVMILYSRNQTHSYIYTRLELIYKIVILCQSII